MDTNARGYPAIIPPEVRYDKDLPPNAKLLYGELTVLCRKEGFCWASNTYFAELYGVSKFTISRWVSSLVDKGYIRIEMAPRDSTTKEVFRKVYLAPHLLTKSAIGIDEISNTPPQKAQGVLTETAKGYCQNQQGGIDENRKENKERLTSKDEQSSRETPPTPPTVSPEIMKAYQEEIRLVASPRDMATLHDYETMYPQDGWVVKAIERAALRNKRNLGYVGSILRSWKENGYDEEGDRQNGQNGQGTRRNAQRAPRQTGSDWSQVKEYRPGWG